MSIMTRLGRLVKSMVFRSTFPPIRRWLRGRWEGPGDTPPVGLIRFGSFRRLEPFSREWGDDRGGPIDRYYIENFLRRNRKDIRGRVLEIAEDVYTRWFGQDRVTRSDILEYEQGENPRATLVADLTSADHIPSNTFDCVIITQTLQLIYDVGAAVETIHRILKPGGVALITVPGISQINRQDSVSWGEVWCWSFTMLSMKKVFSGPFPAEKVQVVSHGNVLVAASFLYGLGRGELTKAELDHHDPDYELLISVRAQKSDVPS